MEEEDPYESLPESSPIVTHMLAGAAAGIGEHCVMYPFDCVKTRMQSLVPDPKANYRGLADALVTIFRYEGLGKTVRGINAVIGGAGPAHALYFACYEYLKKRFSQGKSGNHLAHGAAGCVATVLHDMFMNPADDCGRYVLKTEGPVAFYRSFTTQLSMNVPYQAIHFVTYEYMQEYLNPDRKYNPWTHGVSGAAAGASAAIVTMPLDVCKTLLNTQEICARTKSVSYVSGMGAAFKTVYEFQGFSGFFRGLQARILYQMPATAISWSVYEFFKFALIKKDGFKADSAGSGYLPGVQAQNGSQSDSSSTVMQVTSKTLSVQASARSS